MKLRVFLRDQYGTTFESMALALSVIAVLFVAAADLLHYASKKDGVLAQMLGGDRTQIARAENGQSVHGSIDYTPTGIIGLRRAPAVDPCTVAPK